MKNLLLLFLGLILFSQLSASVYFGKNAESFVEGAEIVRFKDFSDIPCYIKFRKGSEIDFADINRWMQTFFKPDNRVGLVLLRKETDKSGTEHYRYQQIYNNIPIEFTNYIFHVKNGKVISINGNLFDKLSDLRSTLTGVQALEKARQYVGAKVYKWELPGEEAHLKQEQKNINASYFPQAELVYVPEQGNIYKGKLHLAYKFNIYAHKPLSRSYVYVDANNGEIVFENKIIKTVDVIGSAQTVYSGTKNITTDSFGGSYRLRESGRGNGIETYDMNMTTNYGSAVDFTDIDNNWNNINVELDEYATDAHWAAEMTYDYYFNLHGRNSIDGNGFALLSYVHFNLIDYGYSSNVNAFWDGNRMSYGDGNDSNITPLTTVDICGHEITHGLNTFTADLVYSYESGALSEGFSDVFGTSIEFYAKPTLANWTIGEDIGSTFRSMENPNLNSDPDTYLGTFWATGSGDNGGVHTNSGVLNHWYYLLSMGGSGINDNGDNYNVTGLGIDVAGAIAFRTLTVYLTSSSQYYDARYYAILSAIDLYGACSPEVESVTNAFYAVGIGNAYTPNVTSDFVADMTESCAAPFTVQFTNMSVNGTSFLWNFGDGNTSTAISPSHTYNALGTYNVELFSDGGTCGSDTILKTSYIIVDTTVNCISIMPVSGTFTHSSCEGKLYDTGGPSGNYPDNTDVSFTISPVGASQITLTILSFDVEAGSGSTCDYDYIAFYDGPNTASPLINTTNYCNTTGSPVTITSSGGSITIRQFSDQAVNGTGFELDWICSFPTSPPVANFVPNITTTCNGLVSFTDLSTNGPSSWDWSFGDGNTSTNQNPSHIYSQSGAYSVTLTVTNAYGNDVITMTNLIVVDFPIAPVTQNDTICENEIAVINATATGDINWYDSNTGSNLLFTGNTYTTPPLANSTTYWLQNSEIQAMQYVGEINSASNGAYLGFAHFLVFDCISPVTLVSVEVNAETTANRTIELRDNTGTVLETTTINIPLGTSRINLNFNIPVGNNFELGCIGTPDLFRTNVNTSYPYVLPGIISINYSSATTDPTGYYYYFYDWEVQEPACVSTLDSVEIIVETCINVNETVNNTNYQIYPNPTNNKLFVRVLPVLGNTEIQLIDVNGKLLDSISNKKSCYFDMSNLAGGVYFCKIITDENIFTEQVILIK